MLKKTDCLVLSRKFSSPNALSLLFSLALTGVGGAVCHAQTAFLDFNTAGQYSNSFNPWNDVAGADGGNYAFLQIPTNGVGGSGCVSVFQTSDTTATYKAGSWDFSTNGAAVTASLLIKANGLVSGDKVQLGLLNMNNNGLNNNPGVAFESFRLIPQSSTAWILHEQFHSLGAITDTALGPVNSVPGRWYKFVVSVTNTAGASGNYTAGCAIYDYGTDGLTPGTNIVTFSSATNHTGQTDVTVPAVWPALRAFQDAGIDAPPLHFIQGSNVVDGFNGVFSYGDVFPTDTYDSRGFGIDIEFQVP